MRQLTKVGRRLSELPLVALRSSLRPQCGTDELPLKNVTIFKRICRDTYACTTPRLSRCISPLQGDLLGSGLRKQGAHPDGIARASREPGCGRPQ